MSDVKHTPGPWFSLTPRDKRICVYGGKEGPPPRGIGEVWDISGHEENQANARLIAAAPDLLEALKEIAKIGREDYGPAAAARMDEVARTAIAKAEGRS